MGIKIWEKFFVREFTKCFLLFLGCFYGLYILIDYASHTSALPHHQIQIHGNHLVRYYFYVFASRIEILIPVALLIALVKTLTTLNAQNELVALMAGGIPLKKLMRPFILIALVWVGLLYANEQFILPEALRKLRRIEDATKQQKPKHLGRLSARHVILEDNSLLLFQSYDTSKEEFFDAYWVETIDSIYRIKFLSPHTQEPTGKYVDHLLRQPDGKLIQQNSYPSLTFPKMKFSQEALISTITDPEILPIWELGKQVYALESEINEKESKLLTAFYWKLMMPWLCLLAVLVPMPFCVRFSRNQPLFFIYVGTLFGLIAFYLFLDAVQVISNRQVVAPFWVIGFPYVIALGWGFWRFSKLA